MKFQITLHIENKKTVCLHFKETKHLRDDYLKLCGYQYRCFVTTIPNHYHLHVTMSPPFFSDISQNINTLLNKDFFQNIPAAVNVSTTTKSGLKFTVNGKQFSKEGPLQSGIEAKFRDKVTGLVLTQGWTNQNKLNTRVDLSSLAPGLKTDFMTSIIPNSAVAPDSSIGTTPSLVPTKDIIKTAIFNVSFVQPIFAAKGTFDLLKKPNFIGNLTLAHEGFIAGTEFGYDINAGTVSRYAVALSYRAKDYNLGISINDAQLTTASFFQNVSRSLQVGSKATLNPKLGSNVSIEFATRYLPDSSSQIKAKISDVGKLTLSYKQDLRPGITLGVGTSLDALKLDEPLHKVGWSLNFSS